MGEVADDGPDQVTAAQARVGCGVLVVMLLIGGLVFLFVRGVSGSFPDDPRFTTSGEQTRELAPGSYAVYISATGWSGDVDLPVEIRVTDASGRAVPLARDVRAPFLREPGEGGESFADQGRFTVTATGSYTVSVTGSDGRGVIVTPPRSRWDQWGPVLLAAGSILGVFAVLLAASRLAAARRAGP